MENGRYKRLMSIESVPCNEDEPLRIIAGAILEDNVTHSKMIQLKLENVCDYVVKKASVVISFNSSVEIKDREISYSYEDVMAKKNDCFGENEAIIIPANAEVKDIKITLKDVDFSNEANWESGQDINQVVKDHIYSQAKKLFEEGTVISLGKAVELFQSIETWRDSEQLKSVALNKIENIMISKKKKKKTLIVIIALLVAALIAAMVIYSIHKKKIAQEEAEVCASLAGKNFTAEVEDWGQRHCDFTDDGKVHDYSFDNDGENWGDTTYVYKVMKLDDDKYALDFAVTEGTLFYNGKYDYLITDIEGTQITEFTDTDSFAGYDVYKLDD